MSQLTTICAICQEDNDMTSSSLECGHYFHKGKEEKDGD